jgi:hypothetical protein
MMEAASRDEIAELRLPAFRPVVHVVAVDVFLVSAARQNASFVP